MPSLTVLAQAPHPHARTSGLLEILGDTQPRMAENKRASMANVHDIAAYILKRKGAMTAMKLQKLVYYSQAWSLVWDEAPLFPEPIEAWANGPVVPALYALHQERFHISDWSQGNPEALSQEQRETVDAVLEFYGNRASQWLSDLTHLEAPWRKARGGLRPDERGGEVITQDSLAEYYGGLRTPSAG